MDNNQDKRFKIVNLAGEFSNGAVLQVLYNTTDRCRNFYVKWSKKGGKVWTGEKKIKSHLLKCATHGIDTSKWRVIEVIELPTKPINEWFDEKMLLAILKEKK